MIHPLPDLYVEHLADPRGQDDLPAPEATGQRGSMVSGLGVRVTLRWRPGPEGDAVIRDAAARAFGSPAALPAASYLSGYLVGMTPEAAAAITPEDLLDGLAGPCAARLPHAVHRGAVFAVEALRCALGLPGCRPADPSEGILVCRCLTVGDRQIRRAIHQGARTPEEIGEACGACTGCRSCRSDLLLLLHEEAGAPWPPPPRDMAPLARIAWARVGPFLAAHRIPLRDVGMTDRGVVLHVRTSQPGAGLSPRGAQAVAREMLREIVMDEVEVSIEAA